MQFSNWACDLLADVNYMNFFWSLQRHSHIVHNQITLNASELILLLHHQQLNTVFKSERVIYHFEPTIHFVWSAQSNKIIDKTNFKIPEHIRDIIQVTDAAMPFSFKFKIKSIARSTPNIFFHRCKKIKTIDTNDCGHTKSSLSVVIDRISICA